MASAERPDRDPDPASGDTIAAIATPPGRGGIGIVRVSGPAAAKIAETILGALPEPRRAHFARFRDARGEPIEPAPYAVVVPRP